MAGRASFFLASRSEAPAEDEGAATAPSATGCRKAFPLASRSKPACRSGATSHCTQRSLSSVFTRRPLKVSCRCSRKCLVCTMRHCRTSYAVLPEMASMADTKASDFSQRNFILLTVSLALASFRREMSWVSERWDSSQHEVLQDLLRLRVTSRSSLRPATPSCDSCASTNTNTLSQRCSACHMVPTVSQSVSRRGGERRGEEKIRERRGKDRIENRLTCRRFSKHMDRQDKKLSLGMPRTRVAKGVSVSDPLVVSSSSSTAAVGSNTDRNSRTTEEGQSDWTWLITSGAWLLPQVRTISRMASDSRDL